MMGIGIPGLILIFVVAIYLINSGRPIIPSSPQKTRVVHGLVHQNLRHIHLNC